MNARTSIAPTLSEHVAEWLAGQGVRWVFGVSGGGVAPLWSALSAHPSLRVVHTQHEAGAAFCATEASLATDAPVAVFLTTGPGITNALTGLVAAREEGARVIALSGVTAAPRRYRGATQESGPSAGIAALHGAGLFDLSAVVESPPMLPPLLQRAGAGLARRDGFVAHLGIPCDLQGQRTPLPAPEPPTVLHPAPRVPAAVLAALRERPPVIVAGFGARRAGDALRAVAEAVDATVLVTPRAKGVFPASHPRFGGVLGFAGHEQAEAILAEHAPGLVLALGTRLGEGSSQYSEALASCRLILVGERPEMLGALPRAATTWLPSDPGELLSALADALDAPPVPLAPGRPSLHAAATPARTGRVAPRALFDAVQRVLIDQGDAHLMAESGNAFAWAIHHLRLETPRLRVSVGWGSMGHATTGVLGAALARQHRVAALVGDGAMLMSQELATAARHGAPATWIVLDDGAYGMCRHGMDMLGLGDVDCALPRVDLAAWARALGVPARTTADEGSLAADLRWATAGEGPRLLAVRVDPDAPAPIGRRVQALTWAGEEASS